MKCQAECTSSVSVVKTLTTRWPLQSGPWYYHLITACRPRPARTDSKKGIGDFRSGLRWTRAGMGAKAAQKLKLGRTLSWGGRHVLSSKRNQTCLMLGFAFCCHSLQQPRRCGIDDEAVSQEVCPMCGWHCLIPLSRLVPLLRTARELKVLQSGSWSKVGVEGGDWSNLKVYFVGFLWVDGEELVPESGGGPKGCRDGEKCEWRASERERPAC